MNTYDAVGNMTRAVERVSGGAATGPTVQVTVVDTTHAPGGDQGLRLSWHDVSKLQRHDRCQRPGYFHAPPRQLPLPRRLPRCGGKSVVTINYAYDPLRRLTSTTYSNGASFYYTYDAAGNVLEYTSTVNGQSSTVQYTYDAANQLITATKDSTVWHYTYDGNGSLIQSTPGDEISNGAKRYTYSAAGYLVKVETYTNRWQSQAEMAYDGLGNRLEMTGYAEGQSVTTQYELDNGRVLAADAGDLTTYYLYGLGPMAELTDSWSYSLPDGTNTPRQLTDASGEVTLAVRYCEASFRTIPAPFGDASQGQYARNLRHG